MVTLSAERGYKTWTVAYLDPSSRISRTLKKCSYTAILGDEKKGICKILAAR